MILPADLADPFITTEAIFVKLDFSSGKSMLISCVYIPPNSDDSFYFSYLKNMDISRAHTTFSDPIIVFSDFNLPHINWATDEENINTLVPLNLSSGRLHLL